MTQANKEISKYFESLGYEVSCKRYGGEIYHEIFKDGTLVAKIDYYMSLSAIKNDLIHVKENRNLFGVSKYDYILNGDEKLFDELLEKIK